MKKNIFIRAYHLIPPTHRKKGIWIVSLLVINSFLDFFSIAFFVPLILLIINPSFVSSNAFAGALYSFLGMESIKSFIIYLTLGVLVFVLVKNIFSVWIARIKINYAFEIAHSLSSRAISNYMEISFADFSHVDFTRELNRIANYPLSFANNIIVPITTVLTEIIICILFLSWMAYYDYKMLLLLFAILLPVFVVYQQRKKILGQINKNFKENYPALLKSTLQVVEGFPEIKTYQKESFFHQKFHALSRGITQIFIKDQSFQAGTIRLTEIIIGFIMCSLIIYTVSAYQDFQKTLMLLGLYSGASFRMIPSANRLLHASQQLSMHNYLVDELNFKEHLKIIKFESEPTFQFNDSISFRNVSFQYPSGPVALKNISFTIRKGEKVGITGNSGEGKTTLLLLLLRFFKQTEGEILVDGGLIRNENSWRKLLAYVPQNPYIVDGTLSENIAFGISPNEINRNKVLQIIDDLDLNDVVRQLPGGIDSRIGERGSKLSGGQRQRIAIARALYADVEILLFDEATNQVHSSLESDILDLLNYISRKNKTIIMVTHKIQANFFDSIFHLEKSAMKEVEVTHD